MSFWLELCKDRGRRRAWNFDDTPRVPQIPGPIQPNASRSGLGSSLGKATPRWAGPEGLPKAQIARFQSTAQTCTN